MITTHIHNSRPWIGFRSRPILSAALLSLLVFGCDSNGDSGECQLTETQSYSASTPMLDLQDRRVATFQMEQKVRTYEEDGSCTIPAEGKSEIQVLIRNETACRLSFDYTLSIFEGQVGRSVQGSAAIDPGATADQGVLIRNLDVRVDRSQFIVTPTNIQLTSCG